MATEAPMIRADLITQLRTLITDVEYARLGAPISSASEVVARLNSLLRAVEAPPPQEQIVWNIEVFREDDGQFAASFLSADGKTAGMGNYAATPIGALAELCSTLIKVAEDDAAERVAFLPAGPPPPQEQP